MLTQSLIPSFEPKELHSTDAVAKERFDLLSSEIKEVKFLANPKQCDKKFLPFLAHSFKVDLWDEHLPTENKRELMLKSLKLHQHKGTAWAILKVLENVGLSVPEHEAEIVEYKDRDSFYFKIKRDGTYSYNGIVKHNNGAKKYDFDFTHWTEFAVIIKTSISESQALLAKKLIEIYKPVRSILIGFVFERKERNGDIFYNSKHTHGVI